MRGSVPFATVALGILATVAAARTFAKKNYNYSEWTKGRFSEAVTVTGPGKMIFLAGVGSEDESGKAGDIFAQGRFHGVCYRSDLRPSCRQKRRRKIARMRH